MSLTVQQFINRYNNKYVQWRECVALFWQFNEDVMSSENYAADGAINLFTSNNWSTYDKTTSGAQFGDWTIWSGTFGAYTNSGYGHVAMFIKDNGNGTGQFFSQNPNPAQIITLSYSGIVGHLRPKLGVQPVDNNVKPILAANQRRVGNENLNQRAEPNTNSKVIRVIKANTIEEFTGYVDGERINGINNWFMDSKGFVWSGGFTSLSTKGLPKVSLAPDLKANQRKVGNSNVNQRKHATTDSKVIRLIKANTIEEFTGFVRGQKIKGNNIWFADAKGYVWSGAFDDPSTKGLKDLTPKQLAPNERLVVNANVNHRAEPNNNSKVVRLIKANTVEKFLGYVHGESISGNDIWFKDAKGYAWSGGFVDSSTKGLENLTPEKPKEPEKPQLEPRKRKVGDWSVNQRVQPTTESVVIRVIEPNTVEIFTGFVHGQEIDGNDIWFKDAKGFAWSGAFLDSSTDGLKDQTDSLDELPPLDAPYEFTPDFDFVEYAPAHTTNMQHGHFPDKPTHLILHQFNEKSLNPSIEGVISHFQTIRPGSESSAHFVVSGDRIVQMVSLNDRAYHGYIVGNDYIGIEVDPAMDPATIRSVKKLLRAIENKYGYMPEWIKHKDVPQCATKCGYQLDYSKFALDVPTLVVVSPNEPIFTDATCETKAGSVEIPPQPEGVYLVEGFPKKDNSGSWILKLAAEEGYKFRDGTTEKIYSYKVTPPEGCDESIPADPTDEQIIALVEEVLRLLRSRQ